MSESYFFSPSYNKNDSKAGGAFIVTSSQIKLKIQIKLFLIYAIYIYQVIL